LLNTPNALPAKLVKFLPTPTAVHESSPFLPSGKEEPSYETPLAKPHGSGGPTPPPTRPRSLIPSASPTTTSPPSLPARPQSAGTTTAEGQAKGVRGYEKCVLAVVSYRTRSVSRALSRLCHHSPVYFLPCSLSDPRTPPSSARARSLTQALL
jgi:hypothetical protein